MVWWQTTLIIIGVIVFILFVIKISTRPRVNNSQGFFKKLAECCKRAVGRTSA